MTGLRHLLAAVLLTSACVAPAPEAQPETGVLQVRDAWARIVPGVGAIYLTIVNDSAAPDRLVSVDTPAAASAMLHATVEEGETLRMVEHGNGFEIAAGATLELAPGGKHVMLMTPVAGVAVGDTIAVTLRFERGGEIEIEVPVREAGAA